MFKLISAASSDPVSVSELKSQLRITTSDQDTMLGVILKAATQHVEDYLRYALISSTWDLYLDAFPKSGKCVYIQKSPVSSVTSVKYYNSSGVLTTMTVDTEYVVDVNDMPAKIYEPYGVIWPTPQTRLNAVVIRFVAGYANAAAVPEQIKQGILMLAATMFENPSDEVTGTQINAIYKNSEWLLRPLRAMRF